jgi:hypothetical protein
MDVCRSATTWLFAKTGVCIRSGAVCRAGGRDVYLRGDCIEHDMPRRVQLLQQVKVNHVAGQYRTSMLSSRFK